MFVMFFVLFVLFVSGREPAIDPPISHQNTKQKTKTITHNTTTTKHTKHGNNFLTRRWSGGGELEAFFLHWKSLETCTCNGCRFSQVVQCCATLNQTKRALGSFGRCAGNTELHNFRHTPPEPLNIIKT